MARQGIQSLGIGFLVSCLWAAYVHFVARDNALASALTDFVLVMLIYSGFTLALIREPTASKILAYAIGNAIGTYFVVGIL